ncbi:hypothetical protein ANHYDRO_01312 [Anaerococcus hydrogenalis DSM 7454]|uniref:Uncharacterized protein n=1 Tax=Anaerococcus hydrogenalis DSM 7454 TaxID=561177 RepID=B6W9Q7_9FIRM|nr:hypothetical protein ANHYDRO_01312 [Anaerococcus hydrogenalis DSM 7454]
MFFFCQNLFLFLFFFLIFKYNYFSFFSLIRKLYIVLLGIY